MFLHPIMLFWGGVKLQKMLSTGNYATLWSFPAFTAVLCSTHVCTAVCMRVCKVNSLCAYSSTTQKHTEKHKPNDWMLLGCDQIIINTKYHVSYASDLACIKHNRVVKAAGRASMRFVAHLMLSCLLCCALCLFFAEHCLFSYMLFHMLFMPK